MAVLKAAQRNALPSNSFGLPGKRAYPVNDRAHAANAKARAKQQYDKGALGADAMAQIFAKANRVEGK